MTARVQWLFLDTNILVSAALTPGGSLARLWRLRATKLVTSLYVLGEARSNVSDRETAQRLERLIEAMAVLPSEPADFDIENDPGLPDKDRPILLGAIAARADYLLTGDVTHFGACIGREVHGVRVLTPGEYLRYR